MDKKYLPEDINGRLARISEECAEVIQAVSKAQRFGLSNYHPEKNSESNFQAILREFNDAKYAVRELLKIYSENKT